MLKVGDRIPEFEVLDEQGKKFSFKKLIGKKTILFFYPNDLTPTCIVEACNFRDNFSLWKKKGYQIIGISANDAKRHQQFISRYQLPFKLLADTDRKMIDLFGVWGPKKFMGRDIVGIYRTTFLVDKEGVITHVVEKVKSKIHTEQILELL